RASVILFTLFAMVWVSLRPGTAEQKYFEKEYPYVVRVETLETKTAKRSLSFAKKTFRPGQSADALREQLKNESISCDSTKKSSDLFSLAFRNANSKERRIYEFGDHMKSLLPDGLSEIMRCRIHDVRKLRYTYSDGTKATFGYAVDLHYFVDSTGSAVFVRAINRHGRQ
ncbi:MAG: hypothetical protein OEO83_14915, partial [Alphaproteobacteria bacterium]|nr:hypothetical protein [Alphaproteobacteria bacterium]